MAAKILDGFFIGDSETSMDAEFLDLNKITRLVNLAGMEVSNIFSGRGFAYDTYNWEDQPDYVVFPAMERDHALRELIEFIDGSLRKGMSVLVFSLRGVSRNVFAACAYLMYKYSWGFEKSYDFVLSKKSDVQVNQGFVQQLFALEKRLQIKRHKYLQSSTTDVQQRDAEFVKREQMRKKDWDPIYLQKSELSIKAESHESSTAGANEFDADDEGDEILLVYSFLNSKNTLTSLPGPYLNAYDVPKNFRLRFHSVLQEEGVHMFPSSPSPPNAKAKFGILKKKKSTKPIIPISKENEPIYLTPTKVAFNPSSMPLTPPPSQNRVLVSNPYRDSIKITKGSAAFKGNKEINKDIKDKNVDVSKENTDVNGVANLPVPAPKIKGTSREVLREITPTLEGLAVTPRNSNPNVTGDSTQSERRQSHSISHQNSEIEKEKSLGTTDERRNSMTPEDRLRHIVQDLTVTGPGGVPRGDDKYDLKGRLGFSKSHHNNNNNNNSNNDNNCDHRTTPNRNNSFNSNNNGNNNVPSNLNSNTNTNSAANTSATHTPSKGEPKNSASGVSVLLRRDVAPEPIDRGHKIKEQTVRTVAVKDTAPLQPHLLSTTAYHHYNPPAQEPLTLYDIASLPLVEYTEAPPRIQSRSPSSADIYRFVRPCPRDADDYRETLRIERALRERERERERAKLEKEWESQHGQNNGQNQNQNQRGTTFTGPPRRVPNANENKNPRQYVEEKEDVRTVHDVEKGSERNREEAVRDREGVERGRERERETRRDRESVRDSDREDLRALDRDRDIEWERERQRERGRERARARENVRERDRAQQLYEQQRKQSVPTASKYSNRNSLRKSSPVKDLEKDTSDLETFQKKGNEAAVRVRYKAVSLPYTEINTPNKNARKAWQEDPYNLRGNASNDLKGKAEYTVNLAKAPLSSGYGERSIDQKMEGERERTTPRTYRCVAMLFPCFGFRPMKLNCCHTFIIV